ncbi:ABC transporter substrate-binding protein [Janibacter sp. YIM B02568]|uniref:ABC transporter substrate-binding protein n=1 Tax=Janibacter endophyticus TaxID=2806261 RepID=UPI0019529BB8|nr:ABC transporter substrate-binding protein [Janibacter endophyticus]MBM6547250.1 ABC transporter substrate-binding protein [Janibacter endophyticus]
MADLVPDEIASDGKLVVGTDPSDAPNEFIDEDGKTIIGITPDLAKSIGQKLGLEIELKAAPFDAIIPGLDSGKYEVGMSAFTDTKEREKTVDFVTYTFAGTSWAVQKGNPKNITPDDACGAKVGVQRGSTHLKDVQDKSAACEAEGKDKIKISQYPVLADAATAVASGKEDAWLTDLQVVAWSVKQSGNELEIVGEPYETAPLGIALPKGTELTQAVQQAVQSLIDDGTYEKIMKKWGVEDSMIETAKINDAKF